MPRDLELELKFLVPESSLRVVAGEFERYPATLRRCRMVASYYDTPDRHLARAGIALRMRQEGSQWVQAVKVTGAHSLERLEHEVRRTGPEIDLTAHGGHPAGERLSRILARARSESAELGVCFRTEFNRRYRRIRTTGAVVEIALDEGRIVVPSDTRDEPGMESVIREVEFELVSGRLEAMLGLAHRWQKRFGLIVDLRSKAERGDQMRDGRRFPPVWLAWGTSPAAGDGVAGIQQAVVRDCAEQILRNSTAVIEGSPALRSEHVHQIRVGIRRLRSAIRAFDESMPMPPPELIHRLRSLFLELGSVRDQDILDSGVLAQLRQAGGPAVDLPDAIGAVDPVELVRSPATQAVCLDLLAWQLAVADTAKARESDPRSGAGLARRLQRWHRQIAADIGSFETLDEISLHRLRKRIKRQRYSVEFFSPALRSERTRRYLKRLRSSQEQLGVINDLLVARDRFRGLAALDPRAWFAVGWLVAQIAAARRGALADLSRLARTDLPRASRSVGAAV